MEIPVQQIDQACIKYLNKISVTWFKNDKIYMAYSDLPRTKMLISHFTGSSECILHVSYLMQPKLMLDMNFGLVCNLDHRSYHLQLF